MTRDLATLEAAFKKAWARADEAGATGSRVKLGLLAVLDEIDKPDGTLRPRFEVYDISKQGARQKDRLLIDRGALGGVRHAFAFDRDVDARAARALSDTQAGRTGLSFSGIPTGYTLDKPVRPILPEVTL